jgi:hypothetical protein
MKRWLVVALLILTMPRGGQAGGAVDEGVKKVERLVKTFNGTKVTYLGHQMTSRDFKTCDGTIEPIENGTVQMSRDPCPKRNPPIIAMERGWAGLVAFDPRTGAVKLDDDGVKSFYFVSPNGAVWQTLSRLKARHKAVEVEYSVWAWPSSDALTDTIAFTGRVAAITSVRLTRQPGDIHLEKQ